MKRCRLKRTNFQIKTKMADIKQTEYQPHADNAFITDVVLSCPCCGSEAELTFKGNPYTKKRSVTIKCKGCRLQRTDATLRGSAEWIAKASIKEWNKRV